MRMGVSSNKQAVNLSLARQTVQDAKRLGLNMSELAEAAIAAEVERRDRLALQERIDRTMEYLNSKSGVGLTIADEFGTL